MNNYILYMLESTSSMFVLYLVYRVFLRKFSNFHFNRAFLLLSVLSSLVIPLLDFSVVSNLPIYHIDLAPITVVASSVASDSNEWISGLALLQIIYFLVLVLLASKFIVQIHSIYQMRKQALVFQSPVDKRTILVTSQENFSFFSWIFIKKEDLENTPIYLHELQHSLYWHSLDIVFLKVFQVVFWFNPFLYLVEKELRLQHEFAVDEMVLRKGTETNEYRQLLLNQIFKLDFNLVSNNFNQTFLKSRFIMMTKKENKKVSKWILMAFMVLVFLSPFVISCSMESDPTQVEPTEAVLDQSPQSPEPLPVPPPMPQEANNENDPVFMVVEEMPQFPGGEKAMYVYISENITYPPAAKEAGIQGRVFVSFIVEKDGSVTDVSVMRGIGGGCDEEALRVIKSMPNWTPGKQRGENVRVQFRMPINFTLK